MKTQLGILKLFLCSAFATTPVLGQTTFTWTNSVGGDLATATNYSPNGVPSGLTSDTILFDGQSAGPVVAWSNTGAQIGSSGSAIGLQFHLTANQTNPVNIITTVSGASFGLRSDDFTIDSGAGTFNLGNTSLTNALDMLMGGVSGQVHTFLNNSTNPATIYPNVRWRFGGGGIHYLVFDGTGKWYVTNFLLSAASSPTTVTKQGAGTMVWTGGAGPYNAINSTIQSPVTISGGTMLLKSSDLLTASTLGPRTFTNNAVLIYDGGGSGTFSGPIHGVGSFELRSGAITFGTGQSTFTGNVTLTGGTLTVSGGENVGVNGPLGVGGIISFNGGTLGFSAANTFDYSPRFSTAAGQAYNLDSGGQNVILTNALTSSGGSLTKLGSGSVTLTGANTYGGATTVSAGKLVIEGVSSSPTITVASSAALGAKAGATVAPTTLTVGSSAALEFNSVSSTVTPLIAAGTITATGPITVNVNSGTFVGGQSYPLFSWTSGSAPAVTLGTVAGAAGNLSTNGNKIQLNVTSLAYVWRGTTDGNWDTTTPANWILNGSPAVWANGSAALFDDTTTGQTNVVVNAPVSTVGINVNSSAKSFSITSSGANLISGVGGLTKIGNSTLTLAGGVNSFSGATTIGGGTVSVGSLASGGAASDIGASSSSSANLVLNGGGLLYTGAAQASDRLISLGTAGGTITASGAGALDLNNNGAVALMGSGARSFTLSGTNADNNTFAASLSESSGFTSFTKSGSGKWVVSGDNAISGAVTISGGTLQVGNGGASGSVGIGNILANGTLIFNRTGSITNGTVSGNGSVRVDGGGTVVLPGNNSYLGGTTIMNNSTLQVGNGGATGSLYIAGPIVDEGTLIFNTTGTFVYTGSGLISGAGNVIVRGAGGRVKAIGANTYTGWTQIDPGATFQPCEGNTGALVSSVVTNNGVLMFVRQDNGVFTYTGAIKGTGSVRMGVNAINVSDVTLLGTNTYTGGTYIGGGTIIFGDGVNAGAGSFVGDITFTNNFDTLNDNLKAVKFNRPDDFTVSGNITSGFAFAQVNQGNLIQSGTGRTTLTGNNNYGGTTTISGGSLQVGNGGATGSLGAGAVVNDGTLTVNRSGTVTIASAISGSGEVVKTGSGSLFLNAQNTYSGLTTVSNGTFGGSGKLDGPLEVLAGSTLAPGASAGEVGILTVSNYLILYGNMTVDIDKGLVQSNDLVVVSGFLVKNGAGTLTVANVGSVSIKAGDKFTLFSKAVDLSGGSLAVSGAGVTWQNNLATDGSITALTDGPLVLNPNPPVMQFSAGPGTLNLAWPTNLGWILQTNSVSLTVTDQWFPYPGSTSVTNVSISIEPSATNVFFRMVKP